MDPPWEIPGSITHIDGEWDELERGGTNRAKQDTHRCSGRKRSVCRTVAQLHKLRCAL